MGTMTKMRESTGAVLWILVISFGGLWVLQDSGVFDTIGVNPLGEIIVVDGDPITNDEYQRQLDAQLEQRRRQTGDELQPQELDAERERVFNLLVDNKLREHEMERLGITVSDQEIQELIVGEDPHPIIQAYFPNGQGGVDRTLLQNVIDDPDQEVQLIQLEEYIRLDRRRQKFDNLITATVRVSDQDIEDEHMKTNRQASAEFYFLRYAAVPDDSVELTPRDLQNFYNNNREDFKQERLYTIKVASLSKLPAKEDTLSILSEIEGLQEDFAAAEDDSLFLARNGSERPYSSAFFTAADLDTELAEPIFENLEVGTMVGPIILDKEVHLVKVLETRPAEETTVKARHILLRGAPNTPELVAARVEAQTLRQRLASGEDFAALAREHSDDAVSGARGGDLGWFGPGTMVEPFQDAAFAAPVGRVVGPVETQFGVHLIEVTDRADVEVRIADLAIPLDASVATLQAAEEALGDLQFYAEESGDFMGEAERRSIALEDVQVQAGQFVTNLGASRSLQQFLDKADTGDISDVIELNERFIVANVVEIQEEGYESLEAVEDRIRPRALLEKKKAIQRERMEQAYQAGGFDGLAQALGTTARTANNLSYSNQLVPGLGRDATFAGTLSGLEQGQESGIIEGQNGVFIARVSNVVVPPPITDAEREQLRTRLLNQRKNQVQSRWIASLRENADIEDLRASFQQ